jgi:hypothetical protein
MLHLDFERKGRCMLIFWGKINAAVAVPVCTIPENAVDRSQFSDVYFSCKEGVP